MSIRICIVIPCYNEIKNFVVDDYCSFIKNQPDVLLCFVNDGSTDGTQNVLEKIKQASPQQVEVVSLPKNLGKAEAVRKGMQHCNQHYDHSYIAYLDADLSTTLAECLSMVSYLNGEIEFCFGSRIAKIGSVISRKRYRFLFGRIIATIISQLLSLKVYDTQCGCKVFTKKQSEAAFTEPFISRWLFDVEIFFRIIRQHGKEKAMNKMMEIPLTSWIDNGNSKVRFSYFFIIWFDLFNIYRKYK